MIFRDKDIHDKAKKLADKTYTRHSAYKSMYIVKKYKDMGGRFHTKKNKDGVKRWNNEKWIQVIPYITKNKLIACGLNNKEKKVCRPFYRVNEKTPITIDEIINLHGKYKVLKLARRKLADMDGRVFWKTSKFYPSKRN